jgi:hypothetical protein
MSLKFGFSEKATKFEKIFVVLLTRASCSVRATAYLSKSQLRFLKINVDKSYYTNFKDADSEIICTQYTSLHKIGKCQCRSKNSKNINVSVGFRPTHQS